MSALGIVRRKNSWIGLPLFAVVMLLMGLATRSGAQSPRENRPPSILETLIHPSSLPNAGGRTIVYARVMDDVGVVSVSVKLEGPDVAPVTLALTPVDDYFNFQGTVDIPRNPLAETVFYQPVYRARDTDGAEEVFIDDPVLAVQGTGLFDYPPSFQNYSVEPRNLPSAGGTITMRAEVTNDENSGPVMVAATIVRTVGSFSVEVPMVNVAGDLYEATYPLPPNSDLTPTNYQVLFVAKEPTNPEQTRAVGPITVAGVPPAADRYLKLSPSKISFGRVFTGRKVRRKVTLRNTAPKRSGPITGMLLAPEVPFRLIGAVAQSGSPAASGIAFSIRPGQRRSFNVEFRPTVVGTFHADLVVQRTDGGQAGLSTRLSGKGQRLSRR